MFNDSQNENKISRREHEIQSFSTVILFEVFVLPYSKKVLDVDCCCYSVCSLYVLLSVLAHQ